MPKHACTPRRLLRWPAALCLLAATAAHAQAIWPQDYTTYAALEQAMRRHPPGARDVGAPLYPGAVFDPVCSAQYSWARRSYNIVGWCFKVHADRGARHAFITGPGRPFGPSAMVSDDGVLYQTDPKRQAFFESFPNEEPTEGQLKVRRHPNTRYSRACSADHSYEILLHHYESTWQRAWCYVGEANMVELKRFFRPGELNDPSTGVQVTLRQVLDEPPRTEIEYLIPTR